MGQFLGAFEVSLILAAVSTVATGKVSVVQ